MEIWKAVGAGLVAFLVVGVVSSLLAGVAMAVLFFAAGYYAATAPEQAAPGIGIAIFLMALVAVALAVESGIAGTIASLANR